ncbi:hypothetical protein [Phytohabitans kaempferiae]|uniref:Nitroreductase domain-containing protein n=1 Tax=Phytohabitans kaempferiae TaxID=1620943 RepID=A0ABV6M524_9ACTN
MPDRTLDAGPLALARVAVLATATTWPAATDLAAALAARGVGGASPVRVSGVDGPLPSADLVVAVGDDVPGDLLTASRAPVLRVCWEADHVQVGPQLRSGHTACVACVRRSVTSAGLRTGTAIDGTLHQMGCAHAADEVVRVLLAAPDATPPRIMRRIGREAGDDTILVTPFEDCPACRWPAGDDPLAATYEWQVERPSSGLVATVPAMRRIDRTRPPRPADRSGRRHPMAAPAPLPGPSTGSGEPAPLSAAILASLLHHCVGRRPDARRWAPTGGNLGSTAAVFVTGPGSGVPARPLRFDDTGGGVFSTASAATLEQVTAETDLADCRADAVVCLVADAGRLVEKYGRFAYRLCHLDAGCAAMQLAVVGQAHGVTTRFAGRWSARLGPMLDLGEDETVAAVVAVTGAA